MAAKIYTVSSRIAWLTVVVACLFAALLLIVNGYAGYSAILIAVGISAAVNLF